MRNRERQLWTEYVRQLEERKDKKPRTSRAKKNPRHLRPSAMRYSMI